jgi:isopenicillin-N epimerase
MLMQHKSLTLVDGTHALGNIPLDIPALRADAYIASCSTWLSAAGSAAFTWVAKALQPVVAPLIALQRTGFGLQADSLLAGPADVCAWLSVHSTLAVIDKYGDAEIRAKRQAVLKQGTSILLSRFRCVVLLCYSRALSSSIPTVKF